MQIRPGPTTSARNGTGWTIAFYVRDVCGLPFSADVPPLDPAVEASAGQRAAHGVSQGDWEAWVQDLRRAPAGAAQPPVGSPGLLALYDQFHADARRWEDRVVRVDPYVAAWSTGLLEDAAVRGVRGDVHQIEIVPVAGRWHASISPSRLLVSVATWSDSSEMDQLMRARLPKALGLA